MLSGLTALVQYVVQQFVGPLGIGIAAIGIGLTAAFAHHRGDGIRPVITAIVTAAFIIGCAAIAQGIAGYMGG